MCINSLSSDQLVFFVEPDSEPGVFFSSDFTIFFGVVAVSVFLVAAAVAEGEDGFGD